jgi:UTP--glucose-1-phosphate uridylyltransferase
MNPEAKLLREGLPEEAVAAFRALYDQLVAGASGMLPDAELEPVRELPTLAQLPRPSALGALGHACVIKLNGGLGTSMGLDGPKSLLEAREGLTFLDVVGRQVSALRARHGIRLPLVLMQSFRTQGAVPGIADVLEFLQHKVPKLRADDLSAVEWPPNPSLEWCPPGHGDIYASLLSSGVRDALLADGVRYAFVSNADNLGARPDPRLAAWFAGLGAGFASESCRRTSSDRKGGHLAVRRSDGRLILRETAQTRDEDQDAFVDVNRHRFFNCNNLWLDLAAVADTLRKNDGVLGLPLIRNVKTADPTDPSSPEVIQLETAMGAAIEVFDNAQAVEVDRSRFLPVKTTSDLLVMRSDVYELADDARVQLVEQRDHAPYVELDKVYKLIDDFDTRFPNGAPSLLRADSLTVNGDWTFGKGVAVVGDAVVDAEGSPGTIPDRSVLGAEV